MKTLSPEVFSDEALAVRLLACFPIFNTAALSDCAEGIERDEDVGKVGESSDKLFFSVLDNLSGFKRALVKITRSFGYPWRCSQSMRHIIFLFTFLKRVSLVPLSKHC